MKGDKYVVVRREDPPLFLLLTINKQGLKQWEYVEEFILATKFDDTDDIDDRLRLHHAPPRLFKPKLIQ